MENNLTKNKPVNIIGAAVLTFFMIGLGQIACGKIKRGIILYIISSILFIAAAFIAIQPFPRFNIIAAGLIIISVFLFALIDSVLVAKNPVNTLKLRPLIGYSLLVVISIISTSIVRPLVGKVIKDNYVQAFKIPAASMMPSLLIGDHILVNKLTFKNSGPKRGDVIVFDFPEDTSRTFIRRVVGIGGDIIEIKNNQLYVNGRQYNEDYITYIDLKSHPENRAPVANFGPVSIPDGSFFVLGDNRNSSYDSRYWGFLSADKIKGKAATIYWSWDSENNRVRWNRIGKLIN